MGLPVDGFRLLLHAVHICEEHTNNLLLQVISPGRTSGPSTIGWRMAMARAGGHRIWRLAPLMIIAPCATHTLFVGRYQSPVCRHLDQRITVPVMPFLATVASRSSSVHHQYRPNVSAIAAPYHISHAIPPSRQHHQRRTSISCICIREYVDHAAASRTSIGPSGHLDSSSRCFCEVYEFESVV